MGNDCDADRLVKKPMLHDMFDLLGFPLYNTGLSVFDIWNEDTNRYVFNICIIIHNSLSTWSFEYTFWINILFLISRNIYIEIFEKDLWNWSCIKIKEQISQTDFKLKWFTQQLNDNCLKLTGIGQSQ